MPFSATQSSLSCPSGFRCEDGEACILLTERCDGYLDCSDSSDERNCTGEQQPCPIPHSLSHTELLFWICDLSLPTALIYLPLLTCPSFLFTHLSPAGTNFPAASTLTICLLVASDTAKKKKKNHFRMDRSKAVYFTQPTGEAGVSCSPLLCKVTLGDVAGALLPSLAVPHWPWWPCGGRGTGPTLG